LSNRFPRRLRPSFSPREVEGTLDAKGLKLAIAVARWNPTVTEALLARALEALEHCGARAPNVRVVRVPGAFELPAAARALIQAGRLDAVIVLGAIVRGETAHHEVLGHAVASALAGLSADTGVPIGFGLLTCDTMEQARARSSKGVEAAQAAVEMANLRRRLRKR
jgi:6,7-dimethyl-8-ribityllumazine synthase